MTEYGEELLRQRVWYWLEAEKGMEVDAEVEIGTGRIDLVSKSSEEVWGIEVKVGNYGTEQVDRYVESGALDRLYVASGEELNPVDNSIDVRTLSQTRSRLRAGMAENWYTKEEIKKELSGALSNEQRNRKVGSSTVYGYVLPAKNIESNKTPISLDDGIRRIQNAITFSEIGIIHVPSTPVLDAMSPGEAPDPEIVQEASELTRTKTPNTNCSEEPWVRHQLWQKYGGIPEGHIPNTLESDQPYRPIDLISFKGSSDPTDAVKNPADNKVLGFEVKGESSFSKNRLCKQLTQFMETSTLSQLYLCVPTSLKNEAIDFISSQPIFDKVGIVTVAADGSVTIIKPAETVIPEYDGYLERQKDRKTGYGEEFPADIDQTVTSPYITDEEAVRLKYIDPKPLAAELLTDESVPPNNSEYLTPEFTASNRTSLDDLIDEDASATRVYVLEGEVFNKRDRKRGLVELGISYYNGRDILLLNFTRYEGGYIWFTGKELDFLQMVLHSIESIGCGEAPGQGYFYKIKDRWERAHKDRDEKVENTPDKAYYSDTSDYENQIELKIQSHVSDLAAVVDKDSVVNLRLGGDEEGADLEVSKAQLVDLIASIEILRKNSGKTAELPKRETDSWSQARIARSGELVEDVNGIDYRSDVIR